MSALDALTDRVGRQIDPDIQLVTDFLAGELEVSQAAAVEDRLAADEAFRAKVLPLIKAWHLPVHFGDGKVPPIYRDTTRLFRTITSILTIIACIGGIVWIIREASRP